MARQTTIELPPVNIYEADDQITVAIPIPGAHHDMTSVALAGRRLTIEAEARYPQAQQRYLRHEWSVGTLRSEVELPRPVHADGAKATLTHGILTISLLIAQEEDRTRTSIPVVEPQVHQGLPH